jgi:hypothetical protein
MKRTDMEDRNAVNHNGWNVQTLSMDGWVTFAGPFADRTEATECCEDAKQTFYLTEFRVYEALSTKEKK